MTTQLYDATLRDGLQGAGLSEYLDQIVDDTPVGTRAGM